MTRHERREKRLLRSRESLQNQPTHPHHVPFSDNDPLPYTDDFMHHHMSDSKKNYRNIFSMGKLFPADPATKVSSNHTNFSN